MKTTREEKMWELGYKDGFEGQVAKMTHIILGRRPTSIKPSPYVVAYHQGYSTGRADRVREQYSEF